MFAECSRSPSPARRRPNWATARARSASATHWPPARSTPLPTPSCGDVGPTPASRPGPLWLGGADWCAPSTEGAGITAYSDLTAALDWAGPRGIRPDQYAAAAEATGRFGDHETVALLMAAYDLEKRKRGVVDLDDLLRLCAESLEADPDFAAAQQWRFRHLFVDEFQDVNPLQFRLLRAWLGDRSDLCVVGDPRQAIYGWNGADPGLLDRFTTLFDGGTQVSLAHNHRSSPEVVAAARAVLGSGAPDVTATSASGPAPTVIAYVDHEAEAAGIARQLREAANDGIAWSKMAVLARTNAQLEVIDVSLNQAGIPTDRRRPATGGQRSDDLDETGVIDLTRSADPPDVVVTPVVAVDDPGAGAVSLTSFHRAKGLEWEVVCVAGLEDGLVPIAHAQTPAARAEERRLLHVALSRSESRLHCSWARSRSFGRGPVERQPSPWLAALDGIAASTEPPRPLTTTDFRDRVASLRRALADGR